MTAVQKPNRRSEPMQLVDLANAAGVYVSTASRVINGSRTVCVGPETRKRILASAQRAANEPPGERDCPWPATAATEEIGVVVTSLRDPVLSEMIRGAFDCAYEHGYVALLPEDADDRKVLEAYDKLLGEGRIDGIVVASARPRNPLVAQLFEGAFPRVFVDRLGRGSGPNVPMCEQDAGATGRRAPAGTRAPGGWPSGRLARVGHRATPAHRVCSACRGGWRMDVIVVMPATSDERRAFDSTIRLFDEHSAMAAVCVANINQAIGAVAGIQASGRAIPEDVSGVAPDDDVAQYLAAPLTTVLMPMYEMGVAAIDAVIDQVAGAPPRDIVLKSAPKVVLRESTRALR